MDAKVIVSGVLGVAIGFGVTQLIAKYHSVANQVNARVAVSTNQQHKPLNNQNQQVVANNADPKEFKTNKRIEQLEAEIFQLKMQVVKANQKVKESEFETRRVVNKGIRAGDELRITLSEDEMLTMIEQPYASMALNMTGESVEFFNALYQDNSAQERDYVLEEKIRDFITFHELSSHLSLLGVRCKQQVCEVKGKELDFYIWNRMLASMQKTDWWSFRSSYSTATHFEGDEYFYALLAY